MSAVSGSRVYVVVLNWNGWRDTVECLESLLRSDHPDFQVVVCDNGSTDGSPERLEAWAVGEAVEEPAPEHPLWHLSTPRITKPLRLVALDRRAAEEGGGPAAGPASLVLIRVGENLGFAGGNNVGLRYALARGDADFVWLLNNDTVVEADALSQLVSRARDRGADLCGSRLLYHHAPGTVQALGGFAYNPWLGTSRMIGHGWPAAEADRLDVEAIESRMFGVQGASVLASRKMLERAGLLSERYFLYFEEQDWAVRARAAGLRVAYAPRSTVYHKEGASTGGNSTRPRSMQSDYYAIRSRLLFTRRFYPRALPSVYLGLLGTVLNRVRRGERDRVPMLLRTAFRLLLPGGEAATRSPW
jgi:GT2 family glycosyltransferase